MKKKPGKGESSIDAIRKFNEKRYSSVAATMVRTLLERFEEMVRATDSTCIDSCPECGHFTAVPIDGGLFHCLYCDEVFTLSEI